MAKIILDQWQREFLDAKGDRILRSGRQVGKSTIVSIGAGEFAVNNANKTILIISATERQAYLLFEKVLSYIYNNHKDMMHKNKKYITKSRLELKNKSVIYCLPTGLDGYGIRGFTIDLLIADEAAFINEDVWIAVVPMLATTKHRGGEIWLLSTPRGKEGYFYRCFEDPSFKSFHISSENCDRIDKEFLKHESEWMTKKQYAQEYLGEFIDELSQFFPDAVIKNCMNRTKEVLRKDLYEFYLGVDIARMGEDESTFEIVYKRNDKLYHIENLITNKTNLMETISLIQSLNKLYNFKRIYIDDAGIGAGVFDYLIEQEDTKRKVVAINNARKNLDRDKKQKSMLMKEDLYSNLLRLMERGEIDLLKDDNIFLSLKSIQYEYINTPHGSKLRIFGSYSHIAEGLIRAAWCVKEKSLNLKIYYI